MTYTTNNQRARAKSLHDAIGDSDLLFNLQCALEKAIRFDEGISFGMDGAMKVAFDNQIAKYRELLVIVEAARELY